jgi:hypothetical protein
VRRTQIPHDVFFGEDGAEQAVEQPPVEVAPQGQAPAEPRLPKVQVSVYLSREAARWLDAARLELQHDHGLRATKSALADYAIRRLAEQKDELLQAAQAGELERD